MHRHRGPVHRNVPGRLQLPVDDQGAPAGRGKAKLQHVHRPASAGTSAVAEPEQQPGRPIVGQHVEPGRDRVGRSRTRPRACPAQDQAGVTASGRPHRPPAWSSGSRPARTSTRARARPAAARPRSRSARWPRAGPDGLAPATCTRSGRRWRAERPLPAADPGTRRTPQSGSPTSAGLSRARRERRKAPSSRRRSPTAVLMTTPESHSGPATSQVVPLPGSARSGPRSPGRPTLMARLSRHDTARRQCCTPSAHPTARRSPTTSKAKARP